jgi:hypothetical protein
MASQQPILDEAQIREFLSVLAAGLSREAAAGYIDCPLELIQHLARTTPEFEHAMRRVEIDFELSLVARIMQASEKSPHLAKWLLERMRPDQFGRRPPAASRRGQAAKAAPPGLAPDLPTPDLPTPDLPVPDLPVPDLPAQDPLTQDPLTPELFMPDAFLRDLLALLPGSSTAPPAPFAGRARDESPRDNDALSVSRRGHAAQFAPDMHATSPGPSAAPCAPLAGLASDEPMATPLGQAAPVGAPSPAATFTEPHPNRWADAPRAPDSSAPRSPDTSVPRDESPRALGRSHPFGRCPCYPRASTPTRGGPRGRPRAARPADRRHDPRLPGPRLRTREVGHRAFNARPPRANFHHSADAARALGHLDNDPLFAEYPHNTPCTWTIHQIWTMAEHLNNIPARVRARCA